MVIAFKFIFVVLFCYLIGNINFAKIISSMNHKDITKQGSGNPGTMNVLRTVGLVPALLTLLFEVIKAGVPALIAYYVFKGDGLNDIAYIVAGFCVVLGHNFPIIFNFKGGKGVACIYGMFLFSPHFWWMALAVFVLGFILFYCIEYAFIVSFFAITSLITAATVYFVLKDFAYLPVLLTFLWVLWVLTVIMHTGNIKRLVKGVENKINFRDKVKKVLTKKKGIEIIDEYEVNDPNSEEIVIYDLPRAEDRQTEEVEEENTEDEINEETSDEVTVEEFFNAENIIDEEENTEEDVDSSIEDSDDSNIEEDEELDLDDEQNTNLEDETIEEETKVEENIVEESQEDVNIGEETENSEEVVEETPPIIQNPKPKRKRKFIQQTSLFEEDINSDGEKKD